MNGSEVVEHGNLKEAKVLLIGYFKSDGLVKVNN